jgi:hypothetical protein
LTKERNKLKKDLNKVLEYVDNLLLEKAEQKYLGNI